jgi:glutamate dehydrogenase
MPPEEVDEAKAFLKWLDDGNYIFLRFRRYGFESRGGRDYLPAKPETGLGILRDARRIDDP